MTNVSASFDAISLITAVDSLKGFASKDGSVHMLANMCVEIDEQGALIYATDRFILGELKLDSDQVEGGGRILLSPDALAYIRKLPKRGRVHIALAEETVAITAEHGTATFAHPDGDYPNVRRLFDRRSSGTAGGPEISVGIKAENLASFGKMKVVSRGGKVSPALLHMHPSFDEKLPIHADVYHPVDRERVGRVAVMPVRGNYEH